MIAQAASDLDYAPLSVKQVVQLRALLGVLARDCDLALWREIGR